LRDRRKKKKKGGLRNTDSRKGIKSVLHLSLINGGVRFPETTWKPWGRLDAAYLR
jgi:hypothetical protein